MEIPVGGVRIMVEDHLETDKDQDSAQCILQEMERSMIPLSAK